MIRVINTEIKRQKLCRDHMCKASSTYHLSRCEHQCCGFWFSYSHYDCSKTLHTSERKKRCNEINKQDAEVMLCNTYFTHTHTIYNIDLKTYTKAPLC